MKKVAVITGGTRGIGQAISRSFNHAGYTVAANYHTNDEAADKFTRETGIKTYKWDIADYDDCSENLELICAELGDVSVLVNNAGITRDAMFHKMTLENWRKVIDTNLSSLFNMIHPLINQMRSNGFGRIINISSINALKGQLGQANYCASKAGIIGFTKALAQENARKGVTVNCIAPGYTNTDMVGAVPAKVLDAIIAAIPVGRLGQPNEVAAAALYLANDSASFITGETINVNGGQYMN